jgi:IS30 family transposase
MHKVVSYLELLRTRRPSDLHRRLCENAASDAEVAKVERLLNARPRKSLGFRSPQEVFRSLAYS